MAQLDANIFLQQKGPDFDQISEGFDRGIRLGDMMRERKVKALEMQKQNDIKDAYNNAYDVNPDGSKVFNPMKLGELVRQKGYGQESEQISQQYKAQQAANAEAQSKIQSYVANSKFGDLEYLVKNPNDPNASKIWKNIYDFGKNSGMDMAGYSDIYDPRQVDAAYNLAIPAVKQKELEMQRENNTERREDRKLDRQIQMGQFNQKALERQDAVALKAQEKEDKKKQVFNEIEDRRTNINFALDTLDKQIDEYGTFEAIGPQNQNMDRLIDQIATDMAKLQDPSSVARPSEVEQVKQQLIQSGFKNSNATAKALLKEFKKEVDRRADSAYGVRGYKSPSELGKEPLYSPANQDQSKPPWAK